MYPNPVYNKLTITSSEIVTSMKITNMLGKKVLDIKLYTNKESIDMSNYQNGMYFIQLDNNQKSNTYRIIKK